MVVNWLDEDAARQQSDPSITLGLLPLHFASCSGFCTVVQNPAKCSAFDDPPAFYL